VQKDDLVADVSYAVHSASSFAIRFVGRFDGDLRQ